MFSKYHYNTQFDVFTASKLNFIINHFESFAIFQTPLRYTKTLLLPLIIVITYFIFKKVREDLSLLWVQDKSYSGLMLNAQIHSFLLLGWILFICLNIFICVFLVLYFKIRLLKTLYHFKGDFANH